MQMGVGSLYNHTNFWLVTEPSRTLSKLNSGSAKERRRGGKLASHSEEFDGSIAASYCNTHAFGRTMRHHFQAGSSGIDWVAVQSCKLSLHLHSPTLSKTGAKMEREDSCRKMFILDRRELQNPVPTVETWSHFESLISWVRSDTSMMSMRQLCRLWFMRGGIWPTTSRSIR